MYPRRTKALISEQKRRVARVLEMLVGGVPTGDVQREAAKEFGCDERTVRRYITEVRHEILPSWYEWSDQRVLAAEHIAKLERVYARATAKGDLRTAVAALRQQAEIQGLNAAAKLQVEGRVAVDGKVALGVERINDLRAMFGLPPRAQERAQDGDDPAK